MNKKDFNTDMELSVTIDGKVFKYRLARFHSIRTILDLIETVLFSLQGIRRESNED